MGRRKFRAKGWLGLAWATALLAGCASVSRNNTTSSSGGTSAGGTGSTAIGGETAVGSCKQDVAFAKARVWRLTDSQYVNAVRQLFGVTVAPEVTGSDTGGEFSNFSEHAVVNEATAASYRATSQRVAAEAVETHYDSFMPCGGGDGCAEQLIRNRIARAFGRRLDETEVARYLKLFRHGAARSPQDGVRLLIEATLQSPSFIYRSELGPATPGGPTGQVALTPHEVATLLALSFTNALPDDELWEKADTGALADPAVLSAQVARLLGRDETRAHWGELGSYWLGIQRVRHAVKDPQDFTDFTEELRTSLFESGRLFVADLMSDGSVSDVVTSRTIYLNEALARVYGVAGVTGGELRAVEVDSPGRGAGILTQPALLAGWGRAKQNEVVPRGMFAYSALVCGESVRQPPSVPEVSSPTGSQREQARFRSEERACAECHRRIDPLGLLSERYDGIGRYGAPGEVGAIDESALLEALGPDLDGPTEGLAGLSQKLAQGRRLSDCAAENLAGLMLGRAEIAEEGSCAFENVKEALLQGGKLRDFFTALATSPAFVKRDSL